MKKQSNMTHPIVNNSTITDAKGNVEEESPDELKNMIIRMINKIKDV
jgi:hypothetical protein